MIDIWPLRVRQDDVGHGGNNSSADLMNETTTGHSAEGIAPTGKDPQRPLLIGRPPLTGNGHHLVPTAVKCNRFECETTGR